MFPGTVPADELVWELPASPGVDSNGAGAEIGAGDSIPGGGASAPRFPKIKLQRMTAIHESKTAMRSRRLSTGEVVFLA